MEMPTGTSHPLSMLTVYDFPYSAACYRVRIACALKDITPLIVSVDLNASEHESGPFGSIAQSGLVPVLTIEDGKILTQSLAIIRYLDRIQAANPLFPDDPIAAARVGPFAMAIACDVRPLNNLRVSRYRGQDLGIEELARTRWYAHWFHGGLAGLEQAVEHHGRSRCVGDTITAADFCLVPELANARGVGIDLMEFPRLAGIDA